MWKSAEKANQLAGKKMHSDWKKSQKFFNGFAFFFRLYLHSHISIDGTVNTACLIHWLRHENQCAPPIIHAKNKNGFCMENNVAFLYYSEFVAGFSPARTFFSLLLLASILWLVRVCFCFWSEETAHRDETRSNWMCFFFNKTNKSSINRIVNLKWVLLYTHNAHNRTSIEANKRSITYKKQKDAHAMTK